MPHPLFDVDVIDTVAAHLASVGTVFRVFDQQDSGCESYGVAIGPERWFVKTALTAGAVQSLERAKVLHAAVKHPAIISLRHALTTADGVPVLVYPWVDGELLYHATVPRTATRTQPDSPMARFRRLPVAAVEVAIARVLDAHLAVESAGFVAVDFYDGCLLYDFERGQVRLVDFDEYRPGPFVSTEQLSGSRRFMAPEEYGVGHPIDIRTTVFTLGRAARLLLDAGDEENAWRGTAAQLDVVRRATDPDPAGRYPSVRALADSWRQAC
ncbi:MAG: hypothetical protein ACR2KO_01820 [Geodermatophilaceae bacterium]|nr:serine/threonine protein kinase [Geodermatophilaceae bacterium]